MPKSPKDSPSLDPGATQQVTHVKGGEAGLAPEDTQRIGAAAIQAATNDDPENDDSETSFGREEKTEPRQPNPWAFNRSIPQTNRAKLLERLGLNNITEVDLVTQSLHASYLIIDAATSENPENLALLASEMKMNANSRDFITTQDDEGNIIVFALCERGGIERLFNIHESLRKAAPASKVLIGEGTIQKKDENLILSDSNLGYDTLATLLEGETAVNGALAEKMASGQNRVGKNIKLYTGPHANPKLVKLLDTVHLVSQELGGPDRFIGYQDELKALLDAATDDTTNIISLEAHAGHGKSRIRTELLRILPNSILCSMNPDNKNSLGSGLATVLQQLSAILKEEALEPPSEAISYKELVGLDEYDNPLYTEKNITFSEFHDLPDGQRTAFAALHPQTVNNLCYYALEAIRVAKNPKTLFVLEDLHHADSLSEEYLVELAKKYSNANNGESGKAMITIRPEESLQSLGFKDLKTDPDLRSKIKVVSLKGLDFEKDDSLARDFAFYSLPPSIRKDENGQDRKIGTWYRILAKKAGKSPLNMKTFMDKIKEFDRQTGTYPNLEIREGVIEIKDAAILRRIEEINPASPDDQAGYQRERLANLDEQSRTFLQYIALMAEELGPLDGVRILQEIMHMDHREIKPFTSILREGGYLRADSYTGNYCKLQHESARKIVLDSIPKDKKVIMTRELYDLFKEDDSGDTNEASGKGAFIAPTQFVTPKVLHSLTTIIAEDLSPQPSYDPDINNFWREYEKLTETLFKNAESKHDVETISETAATVLNNPTIKACLKSLEKEPGKGSSYPNNIIKMAISCLFNLAESSGFSGRYETTEKALGTLIKIHGNYPQMVDNMRIQFIKFDNATSRNKTSVMKEAYLAALNCGQTIPPVRKAMMEVLLAHYEGDYQEVNRLYQINKQIIQEAAQDYAKKHASPSPQHLEIRRICEAKMPFERIRLERSKAQGQKHDDDVIMHPGALTKSDLEEMRKIGEVMDRIEGIRSIFPIGFGSEAELRNKQQQGLIKAFLGDHKEAVRILGETWRIANKMGKHDQAARLAKDKGDILTLQAFLHGPQEKAQKIELLRQAIDTFSIEGIQKSLLEPKVSEEFFFQFLLRIQRIYAIASLLIELNRDEDDHLEEISSLTNQALEDFQYVNTSEHWKKSCSDPEIQFYITGHIGNILKIAHDHKIDPQKYLTPENNIYDPDQYPYMQLEHVEAAIKYGEGMTDLGLGKVQATLDGLAILASKLRILKNNQLKQKRHARDAKLAKVADEIPVLPNPPIAFRPVYENGPRKQMAIEEKAETPAKFSKKAADIETIYLELSQNPENDPQLKINAAIEIFMQINKEYPKLATNPQAAYQVIGLMGHIIHLALKLELELDQAIFDETSCPYAKLENVKATYDYAQTVYDFGEKFEGQEIGITEQNSEGLFTLLAILHKKDHERKIEARAKKDAATLEKRKAR